MSGRPAVYAYTAAGGPVAVDRQLDACRRYLTRLGLSDPLTYADTGGGRADRARMLADVDAGLIRIVVVSHLDRMSRGPDDLEDLADRLDAARCELHSAHDGEANFAVLRVVIAFGQHAART